MASKKKTVAKKPAKASPAKKKSKPAPKKKAAPAKKSKSKSKPAPKAKKPVAKAKKPAPKAKKSSPKPAKKKPVAKKAVPVKKVAAQKAPVHKTAPVKQVAKPAEKPVSKPSKSAVPVKAPAPKVEKPKAPERDPIEDDPLLAAARKRDEGAAERRSSKRSLRNIVLPRPPIFPKRNEEPLPPLPKVTGEKRQFKIEFELRASPRMLYNYLSTASGLAAWFANDVNVRDGVFTFFWNGSSARAKTLFALDCRAVCFQWIDEPDHSYFLFEIVQDDITGDVALNITDFALPYETDQNRLLWHSQVSALSQVIGS